MKSEYLMGIFAWLVFLALLAAALIVAAYVKEQFKRARDQKRVARVNRRMARLKDRITRAYKWVDRATSWADTQSLSKERTLHHCVADAIRDDRPVWCAQFYRRLTVAQQLVEESRRFKAYVSSPYHRLAVLEERYMKNYHPNTIAQGIRKTDLDRLSAAAEKLEEELSLLQEYLDGNVEQ